ncbi:hypothetical protein G0Q06_05160 [Puniceicoccales bacterium CK1056]|uniref:Uncharacterized protein n=1 Tax=Oceanipulchritudo coccoides TaxID=2706888 RepID=A0A6B2LZG2_9BACT|nr:hypothetical protein [Oceanipulchritudo coccoides]NDV61833.1 hypothetical protein [Oceanipulchritudo coccoides]
MDGKKSVHLLGVGLDNDDGHKRLTQAEKFSIIGGSEETHERMTETLIKTVEDLKVKGKELESTDTKELAEIIHNNTPR